MDPDKRKHDTFIGKLAESHTWITFNDICDISKPDWNIYAKRDKSWRPDLQIKFSPPIQCHVKGQDMLLAKRWSLPTSWVCQFKNPDGKGGKDKELFETPGNSLVVCVSVNLVEKTCRTLAIVPAAELLSRDLYEPMALAQHRDFKKAVYADTLKENGFLGTIPSVMYGWPEK